MKTKTRGYCDNTDCPNADKEQKLTLVEMRKEFEGGKVYWCEDCIKRDGDMIAINIKK